MDHISLLNALREDTLYNEACKDIVAFSETRKIACEFRHKYLFVNDKLYVPEALRTALMFRKHDVPAAGHPGIKATTALVARNYWWPAFPKDVRKFVAGCEGCARNKIGRHKTYGSVVPLLIPQGPWQFISMDFVGPLPESYGCNFLLVVKC